MRRLSEGIERTSGIGGHGYKDSDVVTRRQDEITQRDIQTELLVVQSPGLYSLIQRQCPKTESDVLGKGTSPHCGKVQDPEE